MTPALNLLLETSEPKLPEPVISFLDPLPAVELSTESEQSRKTAKRPRAESSSNFDDQPSTKFGLLSSYLTSQEPFGLFSSQEKQDEAPGQTKALSDSEFELATDAESINYPAGSTIAQAIDSRTRNPFLDLSDDVSSTGPTVPQSTPRNPVLRPSGRALIKELFSTAETFNLPKGHPVIAFTEDQISGVLKVVAKKIVRTTQDMMERLVTQASELSLGPPSSQTPTFSRLPELGKAKSSSIGRGRFSETSGAIQSDDAFSSIGYSFEAHDPVRISDPPRSGNDAGCSRNDQESEPNVFEAGSSGGQTLVASKAEALKDKNKRSCNKQGRYVQPTKLRGREGRLPGHVKSCRKRTSRACSDAHIRVWTKRPPLEPLQILLYGQHFNIRKRS